jgi:hypothetical protein
MPTQTVTVITGLVKKKQKKGTAPVHLSLNCSFTYVAGRHHEDVKMVGEPWSTSSSRFETMLDQHQTALRFGQDVGVSNPPDDTWSAVRQQQKTISDASVGHELRNSSPPFEGPGCDWEASKLSKMTIDSNSERMRLLTSRTRSALPRTGSVLAPAV